MDMNYDQVIDSIGGHGDHKPSPKYERKQCHICLKWLHSHTLSYHIERHNQNTNGDATSLAPLPYVKEDPGHQRAQQVRRQPQQQQQQQHLQQQQHHQPQQQHHQQQQQQQPQRTIIMATPTSIIKIPKSVAQHTTTTTTTTTPIVQYARPSTVEPIKFACNICDKSFSKSYYLRVHMRVHTGEKPYSCDLCQRAFSQRSSMTRHRNTHFKIVSQNDREATSEDVAAEAQNAEQEVVEANPPHTHIKSEQHEEVNLTEHVNQVLQGVVMPKTENNVQYQIAMLPNMGDPAYGNVIYEIIVHEKPE